MSSVTDVILSISSLETQLPITKINGYLFDIHKSILKNVNEYSGGNKEMKSRIFIGAFNYFNIDDFLDIMEQQKWIEKESIDIFIKTESDICFTTIKL